MEGHERDAAKEAGIEGGKRDNDVTYGLVFYPRAVCNSKKRKPM